MPSENEIAVLIRRLQAKRAEVAAFARALDLQGIDPQEIPHWLLGTLAEGSSIYRRYLELLESQIPTDEELVEINLMLDRADRIIDECIEQIKSEMKNRGRG